ncbi:MAG: hypothetical protein ACQXXF_08290, partial [Thermoplasmatota archaeon]
FEVFKFDEQISTLLGRTLGVEYRLRGKIEPGLPGANIQERLIFIQKLVEGNPGFFPIDAFMVEATGCPVCPTLRRSRLEHHLIMHCGMCGLVFHTYSS